jgi:hypothetical protein
MHIISVFFIVKLEFFVLGLVAQVRLICVRPVVDFFHEFLKYTERASCRQMQDSEVLLWTALVQRTACSSTWHRSGLCASSSAVRVRVAQLCCRSARGRVLLDAAGKKQCNSSVLLWCVNQVIC